MTRGELLDGIWLFVPRRIPPFISENWIQVAPLLVLLVLALALHLNREKTMAYAGWLVYLVMIIVGGQLMLSRASRGGLEGAVGVALLVVIFYFFSRSARKP